LLPLGGSTAGSKIHVLSQRRDVKRGAIWSDQDWGGIGEICGCVFEPLGVGPVSFALAGYLFSGLAETKDQLLYTLGQQGVDAIAMDWMTSDDPLRQNVKE